MPYSKNAKYYHHRQRNPAEFEKQSFRTVPITHTNYRGKKFMNVENMAVVGKLKENGAAIQSILERKPVPKGFTGIQQRWRRDQKGKRRLAAVKYVNGKEVSKKWIEKN